MTDPVDHLQSALGDRYLIERPLGRGGMAVVYLALDTKLDRRVALKVLRPELAASLGSDRFLREIEIAATLTHPNILPLYDCGQADRQLYYTMPFVEGESLRDRLNREKQLPIEEALQITQEVADALGHAHALGIVHRDIKPENILFQGGHALVADFGIARAVSSAGVGTLTETGLAVGTPAYMSPEQATGSKDVDTRSDLYSLGCVLYEMLSGETPYLGNTPQAIVAKKLTEPTPRVSVVRDTVPPAVEAALNKALSRTPADRFATMAEFARALEGGRPRELPGREPVVPSRGGTSRRRRWLLTAGLAIAGTGAAVLWFAWPFLSDPQVNVSAYEKSIAVLYFDDESTTDTEASFSMGLAEDVMSRLAKVHSLRVVPRIDVRRYRFVPASSRDIAAELKVDVILDGTVRVNGRSLVVSVQLIDGLRQSVLWNDAYDVPLDQIFAVQDSITRGVVAALDLRLSGGERRGLRRNPTSDFVAYELYLRGEAQLARWTAAGVDSAIRLLTVAIERDRRFADAYALAAFARLTQRYFDYASDERVMTEIGRFSTRALEIDPGNEVALISAAGRHLLRVRGGDRPGLFGLRDMLVKFKRLYGLNPQSPLAALGIGHYYMWFRRDSTAARPLLHSALSRADAALEFEPDNQFMRGIAAEASGILANIVFAEGDLQRAIELTERSRRYVPTVARTHAQLARYYRLADRHEQAVQTLRQALPLMQTAADSGQQYLFIGADYYRMQRFADAAGTFAHAFAALDRAASPVRDYALVYWLVLTRRLGTSAQAERALADRLQEDEDGWSVSLLRLLAGAAQERSVLATARSGWQRCEGHYVVGMRALLAGERDAAREHFAESVATRVYNYLEYDFSRVELEMLR